MDDSKDLCVFLCESDEVARIIIGKYLNTGEVTYAEFMPKEHRPAIVSALKEISNPIL